MYYGAYTVTLVPGKRFPGIEHLKKLAKMVGDKYHTPTQVLGNEAGQVYRYHFVTRYESLAQYEEVNEKLYASAEFGAWWEESEGLIEFQNSTHNLYRVYD